MIFKEFGLFLFSSYVDEFIKGRRDHCRRSQLGNASHCHVETTEKEGEYNTVYYWGVNVLPNDSDTMSRTCYEVCCHEYQVTWYSAFRHVTRTLSNNGIISFNKFSNCRHSMASLQSARTQCCCCAVGVFAAMFGIFMLSAGICIVLNVTFMEVDTSGLPPNLHNESGKKVVGIILICVALAFLGLSATVSILYFTLCSRKSRTSTKATQQLNSSHQKQQKNNTAGSTAGQERPKSREYASSGNKRMAPLYLDGVQFSRSGAYPRSEYMKPKSYRGRKNARSRSMLPPHQEEDPEATKSTMELNLANETHSTRRSSHGRILAEKEIEVAGSTSVLVNSTSTSKAPVILIDYLPKGDFMETQLGDAVSIFDEDSVSNTCSEQYEETASIGQYSPYDTFQSGFNIRSYIRSHKFDTDRQNNFDDSDLRPPPELPHNIDVRTDLSTSGSTSISSSDAFQLDLQHSILVVKPAKRADLMAQSINVADKMPDEVIDQLPGLPTSYHGTQTASHTHNELDSRSESRSSFNSAFSFDGDDPDRGEMEKLQKRMEKLLESDSSSNDR